MQRWSCRHSIRVCDALLRVELAAQQFPPWHGEGFSCQEFQRGLALALATLIAPVIMVKHDQISGFLSDVPFAAMQIGTQEPVDHLDQ